MTHYFLTRVKVEGFRGINNENQPLELKFKPEAVNSVFAVNATGKSSIFEALCYAIRGEVPKLRNLQAIERPGNYVANLFHSGGTATVELDLVDDQGTLTTITLIRSPNGTRSVTAVPASADPEPILKALDEDFTLIDYEQFTRFINCTPLDRGRSFSALLGLSGYSQLRQLLQTLSDIRGLNTDFDLPILRTTISDNEGFARESFSQFASAYADLTGNSPDDVTDVAKWGGDILAALTSIELLRPAIGSQRLSEIDFAKLRELVRGAEGGAKRDELVHLIESTTRFSAIEVTSDESAEADAVVLRSAVVRHTELMALTAGSDYQQIHDAALRLYRSGRWHDSRRCALCQTELTAPLEPHITAEVAKYDAVHAQEQTIRAHVEGSAWLASLRTLERIPELAVAPGDQRADTVMDHALRGVLTTADIDQALDSFSELRQRLAALLAKRRQQREALEKEIPPSLVALTTQIEHGARARDNLSAYWRATSMLGRTRAKLAKYERWQKFINDVSDEICEAEASLTAARLEVLGDDYKVLFKEIMGVNDVVPALARSGQNENLDVQLDEFHGLRTGLSARALLSESYRNALAVSVFLSAASLQQTSARFIVLDDITSSFNAGHQFRLMEQIRQRLQYRGGSDGLQFIVFSHDGLLEKYFEQGRPRGRLASPAPARAAAARRGDGCGPRRPALAKHRRRVPLRRPGQRRRTVAPSVP